MPQLETPKQKDFHHVIIKMFEIAFFPPWCICPTSDSLQSDTDFKGARLEKVRNSQEKVACIYFVLLTSTWAVLR